MAASSSETVNQLVQWREQLDELVAANADTMVAPTDQLAVENSIAAGVAELAGEPAPEPSAELPQRSILARDLRITTDLVLRALQANTNGES